MRRRKKMSRLVSLLLAAAMIVTSLPQSMYTVNAAEVSDPAVSNEALSEAGTQENEDSETVEAEGETSGDDLSKDGIAEEDSSGDNTLGEDLSEGNTLDEGKADDATSDEGKSDDDTQGEDKTEGETTEDGDTSNEDDREEDAGQGDDEESQDGVEEGEEAGPVDSDSAEKLESEEPLLDEGEEKEPISISFGGDYEYFTVYDESDNDITNSGFIVPYGSVDVIKFKIMPKAETGYVVEIGDESYLYTQCKWAGMEFSKTEVNGGGYECTISPVDKVTGYTRGIYIWMREANRETYNLKFLYSSEDVEELVLTNNPEGDKQKVSNNVTVRVINEYRTSFKLKAKTGKSLSVSYKSDDQEDYDRDTFKSYYVEDEDGYYNFDLGKVSENATITIQEGWKINFEYNDDEIEEFYRKILVGDEADLLSGNSWFERCNMINHTEGVTKGEVLYFTFYPTEEYDLCDASVTDGLGNSIEKIRYGGEAREWAGAYVYNVVPTADMTINIEFTSRTMPVTYVDGVVKNISITTEDDGRECYDAEKKEMTNIYSYMTSYNISFKIEDGKQFDRAEIVNYYTWYDEETGEMQDEYWYDKINIEKREDGTYASVDSFSFESDACEIRIIADDAYKVTFVPSDEVKLYAYDDYELTNELSGEKNIVKDSEYEFRITFDTEYELATPYVIAASDGEERELKVIGDKHGQMWDPSEEKWVYCYYCSFTSTAGTTISVSLKPLSIPLKYDKGAFKSLEISEQSGAKLSEDRDAVIANKYGELRDCEIMFGLEDGKAINGAYYAYTGRAYDENGGWMKNTRTYIENIPLSYDKETQLYTITLNMPKVDDERVMSIDYIQIVAGDKCEISFEGYEGKAEIIDFNSYEDIYFDNGQPVEAVKNGEYLFRVILSEDYNAASYRVMAGEKELPVKYYSRQWQNTNPSENRTIQYYSFTPTTDTTINIEISPLSIPIKYTDSAVKSLTFTHNLGEVENAPELSADKKVVNIWSYSYGFSFELELENGSTLSRIFSRRSNVDNYGNKTDGYHEEDIIPDIIDGKYYFGVDIHGNYGNDLLKEIEIVTDKVNLSACTVELSLDNEYGEYYSPYIAEEIKPEVTVKYEVEEGKTETLDSKEYTVTYENNRNVGRAFVIIKAKEDSEACTGSTETYFEIVKAQAPIIDPISISVNVNDIKENPNRELNLSNSVLVNTGLEQGVKPIWYIVDTENEDYTPGGVLVDGTDPFIDSQSKYYWNDENKEEKEIWTHTLKYIVKDDADEDSESAMIVLIASFENYNDAKVVIEVSMAAKETIILNGYSCTRYKAYDAEPYAYDYDNLYLVDENGLEREDSAEIMKELKNSIKFHYKGEEYTKDGRQSYDSYDAPVNVGNYTLTVELSEENKSYTAAPYEVGNVSINRREICIRAESLNLNVGDSLPDKYSYKITGDGLLEGDKISPEPTLLCDATDTETAKNYKIIVDTSDMDICNSDGESVRYYYGIDYYDNWLTISSVVKTEITLSHKTGTPLTKEYDGEAFDGISLIEAKNDETPIEDAIITVKYTGRGATVYAESETAPVNAGKYTMKAKVASNDGQYKSEELSLDIEITKAEAPVLQEQVINLQSVTVDTPETLDLTQYIPTGYEVTGYGTVNKTDSANLLTGAEQVDAQGVLSYTLKAGINTGTAELTIPLEFKNHIDTTLTVKIMLTSKTLLTLSKAEGVEVNKEYDGNSYVLPAEAVTVTGMPQGESAQPELNYVYTLRGSADPVQPIHAGQYTATVTVAADDENYIAKNSLVIDFEITKKTVKVTAKSGNWSKTLDLDSRPTMNNYPFEYELDSLVGEDEWISGPTSYTYKYTLAGIETVVEDTDDAWRALAEGTVITVTPEGAEASDDYYIEYVAGTLTVTDIPTDKQIIVPDIQSMIYTGSPLKPQVHVYTVNNGVLTELTSKDYKVQYSNNKDAGTGTVTITGKGNYDKTITKKFTIEKASIGNGSENKALGIALKYTDQSLNTKETKLVTSLKYKKALKEGTDYTVTLTKQNADGNDTIISKTNGKTPAKTPKGEDKVGAYKLHIEANADSNYSGYIEKTVYVAGKENLIKNAKITIKTKMLKWGDKENSSYGNYDETNWGGFYLNAGTSNTDTKDFTVSIGKKYLKNSQTSVIHDSNSEYFISYTNNDQAGTATITITGNGETYFGTKSATFKIQGNAFKAGNKTGNIQLPDTVTAPEDYTGNEVTKEVGSLDIVGKTTGSKSDAKQAALTENTDYTVEYKNNVKKGNATIIITANPKSGYVGSIKKTFKIQAADLKKAINNGRDGIDSKNVEISFGSGEAANKITGVVYKGAVPYSKSGATIPTLIFKNREGKDLKAGTDYTVKYSYTTKNAGSGAVMTLKGKGNYSGTLNVNFTITKADYESLDVSVASAKLGAKAVKPKVTVKDGKKALTVSEDGNKEVKVKYENNEPAKVEAWLNAGAPENNAGIPAPTVTVSIEDTENYKQTQPEVITLNIYKEKLDKTKINIKWNGGSASPDAVYMDGLQVRPVIESIKYGNTTYSVIEINGEYFACDNSAEKAKVFKITYGANNKSGKKAGSVTIEGLRLYGGKYTEKFEISRKDISKG